MDNMKELRAHREVVASAGKVLRGLGTTGLPQPQFERVGTCFIRKDHQCGKYLGVSKMCFIACPTDPELDPILALIGEKLQKVGVDPYIAVKERVYGQDIFCTKICGRIIEARFCIVILNDEPKDGRKLPNPNVYYEYGMMTALWKHVIPLQKDGERLAFNIQTHDTIKYTSSSLSSELDRAIKDAMRDTEESDAAPAEEGVGTFLGIERAFEIAGCREAGEPSFPIKEIVDTVFSVFTRPHGDGYVLAARAASGAEAERALTDAIVIGMRLGSRIEELVADIDEKQAGRRRRQEEQALYPPIPALQPVLLPLAATDKELAEVERRRDLITHSSFAIILLGEAERIESALADEYRKRREASFSFPLYLGKLPALKIQGLTIDLTRPSLPE